MSRPKISQGGRKARVKIVHKILADVLEHPSNPRVHPEEGSPGWLAMAASLESDYFDPLVWNKRNNQLVSGHFRRKVLMSRGFVSADMVQVDYDEQTHIARMLAANHPAGENDEAKLREILKLVVGGTIPADLTGFTDEQIRNIIALAEPAPAPGDSRKLAERFGVPPFSVLDARQGYWQERKRAWLALGIQSEIGRGDNLLKMSDTVLQPDKSKRAKAKTFGTEGNVAGDWTGTSIFDPVLCELAYRWFCPRGGKVLDPFAGGSVRGIVAAMLGREYLGIDLRKEQVEANRAQWEAIKAKLPAGPDKNGLTEVGLCAATPIEEIEGFFFKRDDYFKCGEANGGKARALAAMAADPAVKGIVTCGDRISTQIPRAAQVAKELGKPCRIHTACGDFTAGMLEAKALGAEIIQHDPGYLSVVKARAEQDAKAKGYRLIPWGLEDSFAMNLTANQVTEIPRGVRRIVVPVGSGMTLAGILHGLLRMRDNRVLMEVPLVIGVQLGGEVEKRLDKFAPKNWRSLVKLVRTKMSFHAEAPAEHQTFHGVPLDPIYEAKCVPFMAEGDLLWIVGRRATPDRSLPPTARPAWLAGNSMRVHDMLKGKVDFIWTCPPYFDLEVYSDDKEDLSNAGDYGEFIAQFQSIIHACAMHLNDHRFAGVVVGDIRDKAGNYRNFVSHTIEAFELAGMSLYNEAILVTAVGSLPMRIGKQFTGSRKLGKTHQNVLFFVKGDARKATEAIGDVECGEILEISEQPA